MSASEELKALDAAATPTPWRSDGPNEWSRKEDDTSELASHHWQEQQAVSWTKVVRWNIRHHTAHAGGIERLPSGWFGLAEFSRGSDSEVCTALRNALPQIVAVVEWGERLELAFQRSVDLNLEPSLAFATSERAAFDQLRAAVAALEEALHDG
jgi:hypothetical protein